MSTWYYTNERGERISVTGGQLKGLAKTGKITPETIVETEEGKRAVAGKVKGLTFVVPEATPSKPIPNEPEIYGMAAPSSEPSSSTVSAPVMQSTANPFTAPPAMAEPAENPFTAAMPESADSFTTVSPISNNPFAAVFYFIVIVICVSFVLYPLVNFCFWCIGSESLLGALLHCYVGLAVTTFGSAMVIVVVRLLLGRLLQPWFPGKTVVISGIVIFMGIALLSLIGVVVDSSTRPSSGGGNRVAPDSQVQAEIRLVAAANGVFGDALIRGDEGGMRVAIEQFGDHFSSGCSPEFQAAHEELWKAMIAAMVARTSRSDNRDFDRRYSEQKAQEYIDSAKRYGSALEREITRLQR